MGWGNTLSQLREVRETSFLSLQEIAELTRIPEDYLQAIEEEKFVGLPEKDYIIKQYIRSYAQFLEVDPTPILEMYKKANFTSRLANTQPISLPTRKRGQNKQSKGFLYTYRYHLIALVIVLVIAVITWIMSPTTTPEAELVPKQKTINIVENHNRPVFSLQKISKSFPNSETWMISQVDSLHILLQAQGKVNIRVRENGTKGNVLAEKTMSDGESFNITGKKWVVIRLDKPKLIMLKVNDVLIDTSTQSDSYIYEFKMEQ